MEKEITASIPVHLWNSLCSEKKGEVLLVTSSGVYLRFGEQIVLLSDQSWGVLPIGIGLENFSHTVHLLRMQQGEPVTVSGECLRFRSGTIRLVPQESTRESAYTGSPQIHRIRQAAEDLAALRRERGLSMLVESLVPGRASEKLQKENPYCAYARTYLIRMSIALQTGDSSEIRSCAEKLLGLGPGLTPSADDCLLGMLYVFRALPRKAPKGARLFRQWIGQECDRCTNQISAAYLKAIIAGAPFERMEQVFRGLCGEESLETSKLTEIGSTSGSEMLLGMLIALRICGYDLSQKEELP